MDAVGAVASVIAIIEFGLKSAQATRDIISAYKHAPKTVTQLAQDVDLLTTVLGRLSECPLDASSTATVADVKLHLVACTEELDGIQPLLKHKDLEDARSRIRDYYMQLNLYLGLLQAEATANTSSLNANNAQATSGVLQQILSRVERIHDYTENNGSFPVTAQNGSGSFSGVVEPDVMEACSDLEQSVARLSSLVSHDGSTLEAEAATHIIDDLETLIRSARDQVCRNHGTVFSSDEQTKEEEKRSLRTELRMMEGMIYGAPAVGINRNVAESSKLLTDLPHGTVIGQKRLRGEIDVGCGVLTIATNKRRRLVKGKTSESHRDVVASFQFRPMNHPSTVTISITQGQLFNTSTQSIPRISINPIIPKGSLVFDIVEQGRIEEFRVMLAEGKANARVHDEDGRGLLHYAIEWPKICKLLIEAGTDVDEITRQGDHEITPLIRATASGHLDTLKLLVQNAADPFLGVNGWVDPVRLASSLADVATLRLYRHHSSPFLLNEINTLDHMGRTLLHRVCSTYEDGWTCSRSAVACLVDVGADVQACVQMSVPNWEYEPGFTCLHCLVFNAHDPSTNDELESLVYLIQKGASIRAVDCKDRSVSIIAYQSNVTDAKPGASDYLGGYRGDLWDAALAICEYDLLEFRKDYPRTPRYGRGYSRADFERLWVGMKERCPYWDHCRWPETGGDSDHWMTGSFDTSESSGESDLDDGEYFDCQSDGDYASEGEFSESPFDRDIDSASEGEMSAPESL